jgi:hypothetical protein
LKKNDIYDKIIKRILLFGDALSMMKKLCAVIILCVAFSGCSSYAPDSSAAAFSISKQQQDKYTNIIEDTLNSFYWHYDSSTLAYYEGKVPEKIEQNNQIYKASEDDGFKMDKYSGKDAVVYTATLNHYNSAKAGIVYFYFVKNDIAALFYTPEANRNIQCSLNERNIFKDGTKFKAYESDKSEVKFESKNIKVLSDGFCSYYKDKTSSYVLSIADGALNVYRYSKGIFSRYRSIYISQYGLKPISAAFLKDGKIAVLTGNEVINENETEEGSSQRMESKKIMFFDMDNGKMGDEIELTGDTYSCISAFSNGFIVSNDKNFEIYKDSGGVWSKTQEYYEEIQATDIKETDIDNNGTNELVATDGKDLYIFEETDDNLKCIWRTNISVDSFDGYIYPADLNNDGVKEIYICDNTGTAIRYVLNEKGLFSKNNDINYSQKIFAADFNCDGRDDYILSDGENTILNLSK